MGKEERPPITVLIADDHPVVRQGLRSMLDAPDIEVVAEAGSGTEVVALAQQLKPDVTLMDIRMPDMDGLETMETMKREAPATSIIVLTTYSSMQYLTRAVIYGAAGYFLKGVPRDQLLAAVRAVARGESLLQVRHLRAVVERLSTEDAKTAPHAARKLHDLTRREREVVGLIVQGLTNQQIAEVLGITLSTVKTHVEHVIEKLGVSDRTQAAVWAVRAGIAGL